MEQKAKKTVRNTQNNVKCQFCHESEHDLTDCPSFKRVNRNVRWDHVKKNRLCCNCLGSRHSLRTCPASVCGIDNCGIPHHYMLHNRNVSWSGHQPKQLWSSNTTDRRLDTTRNISIPKDDILRVLLKVIPIRVINNKSLVSTSAMLDDGASVSLISAKLSERLGLRGEHLIMPMRGLWPGVKLCESERMQVDVAGKFNDRIYNIRLHSLQELDLPVQNTSIVDCNRYPHLRDIKDILYVHDSKPQIIIGQDNYELLHPLQVRVNEPCATLTRLGWCVHGRVRISQEMAEANAAKNHTSRYHGQY